MHKQWAAEEEVSLRLIELVLHGRDQEVVQHIVQLPSQTRKSAITHLGKDGSSALHLAALRERLGGLAAMFESHVDVGTRNGSGESPLHVCLCHNALRSARLLINNGADVNEIVGRRTNESLLHKMVKGDRGQSVELLLDAGAFIDNRTRDGDTPLHFAARYNQPTMARVLVQYGANVNLANEKRETPLHMALASKSIDVAKILIKGKASLSSPDQQGMTPLHQAVASGATDLAKMMLNTNSAHVNSKEQLMGRTPLLLACSGLDQKLAPLLLSHGADANLTTNYRKSVLHLAASVGNTHALNAVIKHTSNLNALSTNNKTPLHCAVGAGQTEAVRTLLRAGVNPNLKDIEGDTALHMTAAAGDARTAAQLLLHPGLQVNATNMRQRTPLHHALMAGHEETGEMLLAAGCDAAMLDVFEKSAHDYLEDFYSALKRREGREGEPVEHEASKVHFGGEGREDQDIDDVGEIVEDEDVSPHMQGEEENMPLVESDTVLPGSKGVPCETELALQNGGTFALDGESNVNEIKHDSDGESEHGDDCAEADTKTESPRAQHDDELATYVGERAENTLGEADRGHKKRGVKSKGRHRRVSKTGSKSGGDGPSSPRHSKKGSGGEKGGGGGLLGMAAGGHNTEHHEQVNPQRRQSQHRKDSVSSSGGGGDNRRRKLGVVNVK